MKGMSIISEVIFLAVIISLIFLVYTMASPVITSMQASSVFDQTRSVMMDIDGAIEDVSGEGKGSRRIVHVTIGAGSLVLDEDKDKVHWSYDTGSRILSPRSMQQLGNLIVGSNLNAEAYVNESQNAYVLENERLIVMIKRIGSASSPQPYNTSELLVGVYNKDAGQWMDLQRLEISIDDEPASMNGTGYTELAGQGYALPRAEALAHINTTYTVFDNYTVSFTLESGADFLTIRAVS